MKHKSSFRSELVILLSKYKVGNYCNDSDTKVAKDIIDLIEGIAKIPMKWANTDN